MATKLMMNACMKSDDVNDDDLLSERMHLLSNMFMHSKVGYLYPVMMINIRCIK